MAERLQASQKSMTLSNGASYVTFGPIELDLITQFFTEIATVLKQMFAVEKCFEHAESYPYQLNIFPSPQYLF
jgi:hypothetical protein